MSVRQPQQQHLNDADLLSRIHVVDVPRQAHAERAERMQRVVAGRAIHGGGAIIQALNAEIALAARSGR
ncbi:hypothetical protein BK004_04465 [bacterium CG10_46_32]|nr:MAG: hypothetical protein BK004_04465 [bacterium CG10_46_32]PIR55763.1 MAG: hypothetical protein COU73_04505 [Parcubacteria group bacterium CG10_big_fil_rev_8_21_14_0_10_46_32]